MGGDNYAEPILVLERKTEVDSGVIVPGAISFTPAINEDYWSYRVVVGEHQAVVGFPKFFTIGIGFAVEGDDWNVNLPYTSDTDKIWKHIARNKGDESIPDERCVRAIQMIQEAARADRV